MSHPRSSRWLFVLVFSLALPAMAQRTGAQPHPQVRHVVVTDAHCGLEGVHREDHRRCALECLSKGSAMVLYLPDRQAFYSILWKDEDLRVKVLNDFAGLDGIARGIWDDVNLTVRLQDVMPERPPEMVPVEEPAGERGVHP